jgi:hypothetical protein
MELDLQSLFGLLCTAVFIGGDPAAPTLPQHLGSYKKALLVIQDGRLDGWMANRGINEREETGAGILNNRCWNFK